jgi:ubiquinol-cytochrome c reductase cytochrome b subunit
VVSDATLNRFFSFHVIAVPLVLLGLVVAHLIALHEVGSNNPDGIEIKAKRGPDGHPLDGIPSHPYYTVHDIFGVSVFLTIFSAVIFFAPEAGGYFLEYNNFIPADSLKTPNHIAPVWYFTPFYSMLRATTDDMVNVFALILAVAAVWNFVKGKSGMFFKVAAVGAAIVLIVLLKSFDAKFWGVVVMGGSVIILFFLPWLDHSEVRSIRYRPSWHKYVYGVFVFFFLILGYLGIEPPGVWGGVTIGSSTLDIAQTVSQIGTLLYFGFFLLMPLWSRAGEFKPVPDRVVFAAH